MNRQDIELLLEQAKSATHHSHYVIIGSLSILGAIDSPPPSMTMSTGWQERLVPVEFKSGVTAWFLDPNDAAVSKYARSDPRDREWIRAGLESGILSMPTIAYRLPSAVMDDDEVRIATQAILEDKAWMKSIQRPPKRARRTDRDPGIKR